MFKTTWKSYFKNNEKIPGNLLKNLEKSWKYHGILSVRKSGNPEGCKKKLWQLDLIEASLLKKVDIFYCRKVFLP